MIGKLFLPIMILVIFPALIVQAQQPVDVIESVVKVGIKGEEMVYYGFAEGDQLIFNFEEANGKDLKEVEIMELPGTSRFMDYKTSKIENKTLQVPKTAIYKFRFTNSSLLPRVCKYKLQRIPASEATRNFNSTVYYDAFTDTVFVTEVRNYVEKVDTVISNLQDRTIKVYQSSPNSTSKATFNFILPDKTQYWSYYITADEAGLEAYQQASKSLLDKTKGTLEKMQQYNPLVAVAMETPSNLQKLTSGQTINYWITENEYEEPFKNGEQFKYIKKGKVVNDYGRMEPRDGRFSFCLHNDGKSGPVTVTIKVTAIKINEVMGTRDERVMHLVQKTGMHLRN